MLSSEDYKLIEEAARRDNMTVEEWAEATLIKDAQKRMKNYYDDSSLPEDVSLAAEVPEEYGAPRRSGPSSSPPSSARRNRGNKSWRAWHPADVPPACRLPPACCSAEGFPRRREHLSFVVRRINFSLACRSPKVLFPLTVSQLFYLLLFPPFVSRFRPARKRFRRLFPPSPSGWCIRTARSWTGKGALFRKDTRLIHTNSAAAMEKCSGNGCS